MILVRNRGRFPVSLGPVLCFPGEAVFNLKYEDIVKTVHSDLIEIIDLGTSIPPMSLGNTATKAPDKPVTDVTPVVNDSAISSTTFEQAVPTSTSVTVEEKVEKEDSPVAPTSTSVEEKNEAKDLASESLPKLKPRKNKR